MLRVDPPSGRHAQKIVVDAFAARAVSASEADGIVAECLGMTVKSLSLGFWRALEELEAPATIAEATALGLSGATADPDFAACVRRQRPRFFPLFTETYEKIFRRRIEGKSRESPRAVGGSVELALVHHVEADEQMALKRSILAMHEAIRYEKFALDLRVRALLGEPSHAGEFDNPWRVRYICDALGVVCRELWNEHDRWRPIMIRCVCVATPHLLNLYRELNAYLQDCDILPQVRVRTHARGDRTRPERVAPNELFSTLVRQFSADAAASAMRASIPVPGWPPGAMASFPPAGGGPEPAVTPGVQAFNALIEAMARLQPRPAAVDAAIQHPAAGDAGAGPLEVPLSALAPGLSPVNVVRLARPGLLRRFDSPDQRVTVDVISAVMECILAEPHLSDPVKAVFARLQLPLLRSALADPSVFYDAHHPARSFLDSLARALVGLRETDPQAGGVLQLAHRLAERIGNDFDPDHDAFAAVKPELDRHLEDERAKHDQRLAEAIPDLLAKEARIVARENVQEILSAHLVGLRIPVALHRLLTNEWLDHLADKYVECGSDSQAWRDEVAVIDDLMWSLGAGAASDRARLRRVVPGLVKSLSGGQPVDAVVEPWRKRVLDFMLTSHIGALRATGDRGGVAQSPLEVSLAPSGVESETLDARVHALVRGDWCEFRSASDGTPVLARLSWRSPHRTQLLFTHRDGTIAFAHTPASLSAEFRAGRAVVALEDVPLFERVMRQLLVAAPPPASH